MRTTDSAMCSTICKYMYIFIIILYLLLFIIDLFLQTNCPLPIWFRGYNHCIYTIRVTLLSAVAQTYSETALLTQGDSAAWFCHRKIHLQMFLKWAFNSASVEDYGHNIILIWYSAEQVAANVINIYSMIWHILFKEIKDITQSL